MQEAMALLFRMNAGNLSKRRAEEYKKSFLTLLADVDDLTLSKILADDQVQEAMSRLHFIGDPKPGQPVLDDKGREISRVPYDSEWMQNNYEMVSWTPMKSDVIEVNGVPWRVWEGVPCQTPNIIRDVAMESYRKTKEAVDLQTSFLSDSPARYADGVTHQVGWHKIDE